MEAIAQQTGMPQTKVREVMQNLGKEVRRHLRPRGSGEVLIPEIGVKLQRVAKPATKPRLGRNPSTGQSIELPAKPARIVLRAKVLAKMRELVGAAPN
jgi:nucleoid DNA-binding protein